MKKTILIFGTHLKITHRLQLTELGLKFIAGYKSMAVYNEEVIPQEIYEFLDSQDIDHIQTTVDAPVQFLTFTGDIIDQTISLN